MRYKINLSKSNYILIALLFFSAALRLYHINYQSVWLDEICSIIESNPNVKWADLNATIIVSDPHPPLYFALLKTMFVFFGYTTLVARVFSAIVGVIGIFSIYLLGNELVNKRVGLISAFLLSINYFHIVYSQEVRMYSLLLLFTTLSFYFLVIFLKRTSFKNAVLYGFFTSLMLLTQFFGLFVLASQLVILFFVFLKLPKEDKIQFIFKSLLSGGTMILFFIPAITIFIETTKKKYAAIQPTTIDTIKQIFIDFAENSNTLIWMSILFISVYFFVVCKIKLFKDKEQFLVVIILLSWIIITLALPIIRSYLITPMIVSRYFITILPPIIILIALGIEKTNSNIIKTLFISVFAIVTFYELIFSNDYYNKIAKTQFREITQFIIKNNTDNEPIVTRLEWYFSYFLNNEQTKMAVKSSTLQEYVLEMEQDSTKVESFWYADAHGNPYNVNKSEQIFLDQKFIVEKSKDLFDCWTRHYVLKNKTVYRKGSIILSNLTDQNWKGGVGIKYNMLLMDFSTENEEKIQKASKVKFKDGRFANVIGYAKAGNYIQIQIGGPTGIYSEVAAYPNLVEIINK